MIDSKRIIEDINKNMLFLENEKFLNKKVASNEKLLSIIGEKTKELNLSIPDDEVALTLNDMDRIKYEELRTILYTVKCQVDREKEFEPVVQKDKLKTLTRKKNN